MALVLFRFLFSLESPLSTRWSLPARACALDCLNDGFVPPRVVDFVLQEFVSDAVLILFCDMRESFLELGKLVLRSFGTRQLLPGIGCFDDLLDIFVILKVLEILIFAIHSIILSKMSYYSYTEAS